MEKMLGMCGIDCAKCPAYEATQKDDDALREKTAAEWSKMFHADIKPENINCDGCTSGSKHFGYCDSCQIRICGTGKDLNTCAECSDYSCSILTEFHAMVPEAKAALDAMH